MVELGVYHISRLRFRKEEVVGGGVDVGWWCRAL